MNNNNENKTFTIVLTEDQKDLLIDALCELEHIYTNRLDDISHRYHARYDLLQRRSREERIEPKVHKICCDYDLYWLDQERLDVDDRRYELGFICDIVANSR